MVKHTAKSGDGWRFRRFLGIYTILFVLAILPILYIFHREGKTFVMVTDGWEQHLRALAYYGRWLRAIVRNLLQTGRLVIPTYSTSIGYGADIIGSLHYYVIGDPLCLLSALVPSAHTPLLYQTLIFVRLYLAGVAFGLFCAHAIRPRPALAAVLAGSIAYIFYGFALFSSVMHPYFVNPMIYLPLLLWGIDASLTHDDSRIFIVSMCLAALSNFYFLYMLVLVIVPVILYRLIARCKETGMRGFLLSGIRLLVAGILGALCAACILLPATRAFLSGPRSTGKMEMGLFYGLMHYVQYALGLMDAYPSILGYGALSLSPLVYLAVVALFRDTERHTGLKLAIFAIVVCSFIPWFGSLFNGFSYPTDRWYWAISLCGSTLIVVEWEHLLKLSWRTWILAGVLLGGYVACALKLQELTGCRAPALLLLSGVAACMLVTLALSRLSDAPVLRRGCEAILVCLTLGGILINIWSSYAVKNGNYTSQFHGYEEVDTYLERDGEAIAHTDGTDEFYRMSGDQLNINGGFLAGVSSVQYYWSITNRHVNQLLLDCSNNMSIFHRVYGLDARTALQELASVKYHSSAFGESGPYGYVPVQDEVRTRGLGSKTILENTLALPLGYTYDATLSVEEYQSLGPLERQWALLQTALVEDGDVALPQAHAEQSLVEVPYQTTLSQEGIEVVGNSFVVTKEGAAVWYDIEGLEASETYLVLEGIDYASPEPSEDASQLRKWLSSPRSQVYPVVRFYLNGEECRKTTLAYYNSHQRWYEDIHDIVINSGYYDEPRTSVSICFPSVGTYSFDRIAVYCQPMESYEGYVEKLRQCSLEDVDMHYVAGMHVTDHISGSIETDKEKLLVISLPYSEGWSATVDGVEQEIVRANTAYMGLAIEPGKHQVELSYHTPSLRMGVYLSFGGVIATVLWIALERRTRARRHAKPTESA